MPHWTEQTDRGNLFWLTALSWSVTLLGRGFLRILCVPIACFFVLTASKPRQASRHYLQKVLGRPAGWRDVFRHFYTFALVSGDRLLFLAGKSDRFDLRFSGAEIVQNYAASGQGCLLLVSHMGSFDAMRVPAIEDEEIPVRILIDKEHNPAAIQVLEQLNPILATGMIDAGVAAPQLVLNLKEALDAGDMVGIMADRAARGEALHEVEFLGDVARFPQGPWMLAMVLKAPVILCFALYAGRNRYDIHFKLVSEGNAVPRHERQNHVSMNIQKYVEELQQIARANPYNWFNFYNFWSDESSSNN
jgi:predicted LPLAT superfamily acyltransferase